MLPAVGAGASRQSARLPREEPGGRRRLPGQRAALDATRLQPQGQVAAREPVGGMMGGDAGRGQRGGGARRGRGVVASKGTDKLYCWSDKGTTK